MKILITPTSLQPDKKSPALQKLREHYPDAELVFNPEGRPLSEEELIPLLAGCDGYIAGLDFITGKVLDTCTGLKVISRYGVGTDRVDLEAARCRGIAVANTPGANAEAVGELAFGLILAVARKIPYLDSSTKNGGWKRDTGTELKGKTICILGLGAIGKVVARCAKGFGMTIIAYDPYLDEAYCRDNNLKSVTFEEGIAAADVISLHLPLLDSTKHLIGSKAIDSMKQGAILVNASRGGIVDEDAAYEALKSGKLGGLALDAFEKEPPEGSPLFKLDNVVATPHTGAHTREATLNMAGMAVDNLVDVLEGKTCRFVVNR